MTDKVQKIREEVERLRNLHQIKYQHLDTNDKMCLVECGKRNLCNELLSFIASLQEEPVSKVWHDMIEEAENGRNIIIIDPKDFYGAVLRKGGTQLKNHNKERYVKWAYIDDIINVTNKEEPVSEDLEQAIDTYLSTYFGGEKEKQEWPFLKKMAIYFAEWQKQKDSIPVSEDLKEEVIKKILYFSENFHKAPWAIDSTGTVMPIWYAKFGANWQMAQMMKDATEVTVHIEAGNYPYIPQMELYDYDKDIPLAKEGDTVRVIVIKEE